MNAREPIVVISGLRHSYDVGQGARVEALKGVDLVVREGEFVSVIGPNGSGKSTLAKHINALLLPTAGDVWVKGLNTSDPRNLWEIRRTAGMVFQNPDNQIVATVVEEDVAFGPENLGLEPEEIRRRVNEALAAVGMEGFRLAEPHHLSGGQKQRVAIAGVLAMHPRILILDEPTAMLDPSGRAEVLQTLRRLNSEEGITVIHITHFMGEAVNASRVVVMEDGRVVMEGTPHQVFAQVDDLRQLGLDVPQVTELAHALRRDGVPVPPGVLTVDELVTALCP